MADYNFTVRATDDAGAFADRQFQITINNTDVAKFVAVGSTGLAHSTDGLDWTVIGGNGGRDVDYGGGTWCISRGPDDGGNKTRTSVDGINWEQNAINWSSTGSNKLGYSIQWLPHLNKFIAGDLDYATWEVSSDGVDWSGMANYYVDSSSGVATRFRNAAYLPNLDRWVISFTADGDSGPGHGPHTKDGAWSYDQRTYLSSHTSVEYPTFGDYRYCGGMKLYNGVLFAFGHGGGGLHTSVDGINWVTRHIPNGMPGDVSSVCYGNGVLLCTPYGSSVTQLWRSYDGINWSQVSTTGFPTANHNGIGSHHMAYYNGVWAYMNGTDVVHVSQDNGDTWTTKTLTGLGIGYNVAAKIHNDA